MEDRPAMLIRWYKGDGEYVQIDEPVCEIETDMASVQVPAWASGILRHLAEEGDRVTVASRVARIEPARNQD